MSESPPPADDRDPVVVKDPEGSEEDKGEKKEGSYSRSRSRSSDSNDRRRSRSRDRGRRRSYSRSRSPADRRDRYRDRDRDYDRSYRGGGSSRGGGGSYGAPSAGGGQSWRNGDWECSACRAHNFASRDRCYQCGASDRSRGGGGGGGGYGGGGGGDRYDRGYDRGSSRGGGGGAGYGERQPSNFKPGDWMCADCNTHNFAARTACFRCGTAK